MQLRLPRKYFIIANVIILHCWTLWAFQITKNWDILTCKIHLLQMYCVQCHFNVYPPNWSMQVSFQEELVPLEFLYSDVNENKDTIRQLENGNRIGGMKLTSKEFLLPITVSNQIQCQKSHDMMLNVVTLKYCVTIFVVQSDRKLLFQCHQKAHTQTYQCFLWNI